MKKTSTSKTPLISDEAPEITQADFDRATFRVGGKEASRAEWQTAVRRRIGKHRVNIMLDAPIIDYFKEIAGGKGYQTLINETLRRAMESERLETRLRKIIREEIAALR
jgi:uncharacterized protein (DUF4415 family)